MYKNKRLTIDEYLHHLIFLAPLSPHSDNAGGEKTLFCYEICMVYSAQNMSPLSNSELLSMICLL